MPGEHSVQRGRLGAGVECQVQKKGEDTACLLPERGLLSADAAARRARSLSLFDRC